MAQRFRRLVLGIAVLSTLTALLVVGSIAAAAASSSRAR